MRKYLVWMAVILTITLLIHFNLSIPVTKFKATDNGSFLITDFLYHLLLIKAFWAGDITNIYQLKAQLVVMSELFDSKLSAVMPIGASPTVLLILAPFGFIANFSPALANTLWVSSSLTMLGVAWKQTDTWLKHYYQPIRNRVFRITLLVFTLSMTTFSAIVLGQTSLPATGLLTLLLIGLFQTETTEKPLNQPMIYGFLVLLSIKTPYLIIGLLLVWIFGHRRMVINAGLLIAMLLLGLTLWRGPELMTDFAAQLGLYNQPTLPDHYAASVVFATTNTLRSAFASLWGHKLAVLVSQLFLGVGILLVIALSEGIRTGNRFSRHINRLQLSVLLLGVMLLFLPYLGRYEELLLMVAVTAAMLNKSQPIKWNLVIGLWLVGLVLVLNHTLLPLDKPLWPFWLLKFLLMAALYHQAGHQRQSSVKTAT